MAEMTSAHSELLDGQSYDCLHSESYRRRHMHGRTLAFVLNHQFYRVGSHYYARFPNILDLIAAFRLYVDRVVVCAPTTTLAILPADVDPVPPELQVCELPFYTNNFDLLRRAPLLGIQLLRRLAKTMDQWDAVGAVVPSAFGLVTCLFALLCRRQVFFYVRGNVIASLQGEYSATGLRRGVVIASFWPLEVTVRLLTRAGVPTFTMGQALAERYCGPRVHPLVGYARAAVLGRNSTGAVEDAALLRRLVYVGRLSGEKGVDVLLHALAIVARRGEAFVLTIVGDGPESERLKALTCMLGLQDYVTFTGYVSDPDQLRSLYLAAGIAVVPSLTEGIPVAMLEAMALGRVVIASAVGGIPSVVKHEQNGLLIPPNSPVALAEAILRLWHEPTLGFHLAVSALAIRSSHTAAKQAREMLQYSGRWWNSSASGTGCTHLSDGADPRASSLYRSCQGKS
jgi:glycosyltransferase involved in cell wall biosynthesis